MEEIVSINIIRIRGFIIYFCTYYFTIVSSFVIRPYMYNVFVAMSFFNIMHLLKLLLNSIHGFIILVWKVKQIIIIIWRGHQER